MVWIRGRNGCKLRTVWFGSKKGMFFFFGQRKGEALQQRVVFQLVCGQGTPSKTRAFAGVETTVRLKKTAWGFRLVEIEVSGARKSLVNQLQRWDGLHNHHNKHLRGVRSPQRT